MNEHHEQAAETQTTETSSGPPRQRRDASQWRALVEQQCDSGLSVRAFCQQHTLNAVSFYAWRRRLRDQSAPAADTSKQFVRLQPRVREDDGRVHVQFASGATLQCPAAHLPELVRLLQGVDGEAERC